MTLAFEGVQTTHVSMTPDSNVASPWERTEIPSANGILYASPDCPLDVIDKVIELSTGEVPITTLTPVSAGNFADVYSHNTVAYKVHRPIHVEILKGPSEIAANVLLAAGLRALASRDQTPAIHFNGTNFTLTAPEQFAGIVPYYLLDDAGGFPVPKDPEKFVMAMSYESGRAPQASEVPPEHLRIPVYERVIEATGMPAHRVSFDDANKDNTPRNLKLRTASDGKGMELVKYDLRAMSNYNRYGGLHL